MTETPTPPTDLVGRFHDYMIFRAGDGQTSIRVPSASNAAEIAFTWMEDAIGEVVSHVEAQAAKRDWDGWMGHEVAENVLHRVEEALLNVTKSGRY